MLNQDQKQLILFALSQLLESLEKDSEGTFISKYQEYVENSILDAGYSPQDYLFDDLADNLIKEIENIKTQVKLNPLENNVQKAQEELEKDQRLIQKLNQDLSWYSLPSLPWNSEQLKQAEKTYSKALLSACPEQPCCCFECQDLSELGNLINRVKSYSIYTK